MEFAYEQIPAAEVVKAPAKLKLLRPKVTPDRIVDAALALIDVDGLDALSMRKLGGSLLVEAMSLYKHLPSKQAVLEQVRGRLAAGVVVEGNVVGWRGILHAVARGAYRVLSEHPKAAPLFFGAPFSSLVSSETWERVDRRMREVGFGETLRQQTLDAVGAFVMGSFCAKGARPEHFEEGLELVLDGVEAARRRIRN